MDGTKIGGIFESSNLPGWWLQKCHTINVEYLLPTRKL